MDQDIPVLDEYGLRRFGLLTSVLFIAVFGLLLPFIFNYTYPAWPWVIAGVLGGWAVIHPKSLNPLYKGWMKLGALIASVSNRTLLGVFFYTVMTPFGMVLRSFGKLTVRDKINKDMETYRIVSKPRPAKDMEKPF